MHVKIAHILGRCRLGRIVFLQVPEFASEVRKRTLVVFGRHLGDSETMLGRLWSSRGLFWASSMLCWAKLTWEADQVEFVSVLARFAAGLGGHIGGLQTPVSDPGDHLRGFLGAI